MAVLNPNKYMELLPGEVKTALTKVIHVLEESFMGFWIPDKLRDATYHYIRNRGKLIRPTLVLLMAYALGNGNGLEKAILPAASVELIHTASLLQDDIMDQQRIRRGMETPYSIYGSHTAMLASDLIIAKAVEFAIRSGDNDIVFELLNSSVKLAIGQSLESELSCKYDTTIDDYLRLIYYKTASLIESSMIVGAYSVNVKDTEIVSRIRDVGRFVGTAFQVRDDIIDYLNMDSKNPGTNYNEINIVRIMSRYDGNVNDAISKARGLLNEMLDKAIGTLRETMSNEVLVKYISLLRI
ncbi:polyprenyl synthetase family protein [Vulcanisaeta souniana]|uniref:Polyprenyl synthetase n=1 Tax=Vulcanisaeta souniana JCM 11219 TaxID=1293586 RepID=A0A830EDQ0_9CREN|nr:polyprenyl synthetase family protein [Vulcanisaeta souniana]BDR91385.1 polyprenyl synthetase [Vulcanisaeta souniana JCM 11219]GGI72782.1 polyprenyl synthetase [Vulcanisaeta souniana JCM 11219]